MQYHSFRGPIARKMLVIVVGLIVVGTALFVTGVIIERSGRATAAAVSTTQNQTPSTSQDPDGGHEASTGQAENGEPSETIFGLDLENPWFVTAFVLVWVVLIAGLIRFGRLALPALLLIAMATTALDGAEVVRQVGEAKSLLVTTAILVTLSHVALAALALLILLQGRRSQPVQLG